jgi:hypothetical protein
MNKPRQLLLVSFFMVVASSQCAIAQYCAYDYDAVANVTQVRHIDFTSARRAPTFSHTPLMIHTSRRILGRDFSECWNKLTENVGELGEAWREANVTADPVHCLKSSGQSRNISEWPG